MILGVADEPGTIGWGVLMTMGVGDTCGGETVGIGVAATVGGFDTVGGWSFLPQATNPQIVNKQRVG